MEFETRYSGSYFEFYNYYQIPRPGFPRLHSNVLAEWAHRSAVCLANLLGISIQMDLILK